MLYSLASLGLALFGPAAGLPPEQQVYLWSVAGTVIGAAAAAVQMPNGTTWMQRTSRAVMSLLAGLLLAPYAIAYMPKPEQTADWWHAFAASGIAAAMAYVIVSEAPRILRGKLRELHK